MSCDVAELTLQPFYHFTYVTAHSPTFLSLHLRQSSFSNLSVTSSTSQLILQPFRRFTYVTAHSPILSLLYLCHSSFPNPSFAFPTSRALHLYHLVAAHAQQSPWCYLDSNLGPQQGSTCHLIVRRPGRPLSTPIGKGNVIIATMRWYKQFRRRTSSRIELLLERDLCLVDRNSSAVVDTHCCRVSVRTGCDIREAGRLCKRQGLNFNLDSETGPTSCV